MCFINTSFLIVRGRGGNEERTTNRDKLGVILCMEVKQNLFWQSFYLQAEFWTLFIIPVPSEPQETQTPPQPPSSLLGFSPLISWFMVSFIVARLGVVTRKTSEDLQVIRAPSRSTTKKKAGCDSEVLFLSWHCSLQIGGCFMAPKSVWIN